MSRAYKMDLESGTTTELDRIRCVDENKELQALLENNFDLLPGDQIDPEKKRKWLLIKREMPVVDPGTGDDRWSIDFIFADQYGIPTFVECKRFNDTRTRREVIGQMMEYVANGHHYWSAKELLDYSEATYKSAEELKKQIDKIRGDSELTSDDFFRLVEQNLRDAKLRLVFFLDESPMELRSVVDFLNKQLMNTEVLIVEARQYEKDNLRIVVPWLFGFTEEARIAQRNSMTETVQSPQDYGEENFFVALTQSVDPSQVQSLISFIADLRQSKGITVSWKKGCIIMLPQILKRGIFSIRRDGSLEIYFFFWTPAYSTAITPEQVALVDRFKVGLEKLFSIQFTERELNGFPTFPFSKWIEKADELRELTVSLAVNGSESGG